MFVLLTACTVAARQRARAAKHWLTQEGAISPAPGSATKSQLSTSCKRVVSTSTPFAFRELASPRKKLSEALQIRPFSEIRVILFRLHLVQWVRFWIILLPVVIGLVVLVGVSMSKSSIKTYNFTGTKILLKRWRRSYANGSKCGKWDTGLKTNGAAVRRLLTGLARWVSYQGASYR